MLPFVSKMFITLIVLYNTETSKKRRVYVCVCQYDVFCVHDSFVLMCQCGVFSVHDS